MQLSARVTAVAVVLLAGVAVAHADGELVLRGAYYKERSTRVVQPMMDARFDAGEHGSADAHFLVDAITSASVAAGGADAEFDERRVEGGAGYTHTLETLTLGGSARYSTEPDYKSAFGTLRVAKELFDRNFTIGASASYGYDDFTNRAGGIMPIVLVEGHLDTYLGAVNVSQLLSPNLVAGLTYDVAWLDGDQYNVYRRENIAGVAYAEKQPDSRTRQAVAASLKWFVPDYTTTVIASYRQYHDSWQLNAGTPELRIIKDVGESAWFEARYRYHRQTEAYFYEDDYQALRPDMLVSDDTKLSAFHSHTLGAQLELLGAALGLEGRAAETRGQIVIEYVAQDNDFGNAVIAHAALTIPFEY
jgi:hypothetical protein